MKDLIERSHELNQMIRNKNDVEHIQQFLSAEWMEGEKTDR